MSAQHHSEEALDLRELARPVIARKWLILVIVALTTATAYWQADRQPRVYQASTRIFVQGSQVEDILGLQALLQGDRNTVNQASLLRSRSVARDVAKRVGFRGDPSALLGGLTVVPEAGSDFIVITTTSGTPRGAAVYANAFAQSFIDLRAASVRDKVIAARRIAERQLAQLPVGESTQAARSTLNDQIKKYEAIEAFPAGNAEQVDTALPPSAPIAPKPRQHALFGFAISLVLATMLVFVLERLDRRIRRMDQVGEAYDLPVLAALPHVRDSAPTEHGEIVLAPAFREAVRGLRTNLQFASVDTPIQTLLVTSAVPSEGKSTLVRSLALAYREAGQRVCVIECDLRKPTAASMYGIEPEPGLTDVLSGGLDFASACQQPLAEGGWTPNHMFPDEGALAVLTAGPKAPNPPTVLASQRMRDLLAVARERFDVVIIDSPPLLAVADTIPLLEHADGTLLVGRIGKTRRDSALRVVEILSRTPNANLVGVVANDVRSADLFGGAGYGYYGYGNVKAYHDAA